MEQSLLLLIIVSSLVSLSNGGITSGKYLTVHNSRDVFRYNGKDVFLNGANQPWVNYGNDFGGSRASNVQSKLEQELKRISDAGGNVVRMWVFCEGKYLPIFNGDGSVSKSDSKNTLASDIVKYLDAAKKYNVFVILTLWNGAVNFKGNGLYKMLTDSSGNKLQTFINKVLIPLVNRVKYHPALGAWEIINEPEGSLKIQSGNSCTDTTFLNGKGPPWTDAYITAYQFQRFINRQSAAIHSTDSKALVTVGAWSEWSTTDVYGKNLWKDSCLKAAGGKWNGGLDFYQIHSYAWQNKYNQYSPFKVSNKNVYKLDKPVLIGELGVVEGGGQNPTTMAQKYTYLYNAKFDGVLAWAMNDYSCGHSDGWYAVTQGIKALKWKWNVGLAYTEQEEEAASNELYTTSIVGIVIASLLCVLCLCALCVMLMLRRKKKKELDMAESAIISSNGNDNDTDTPTSQPQITAVEESKEELSEEMEVEIDVVMEPDVETENRTNNNTAKNAESE